MIQNYVKRVCFAPVKKFINRRINEERESSESLMKAIAKSKTVNQYSQTLMERHEAKINAYYEILSFLTDEES